ncbi:MAG: isoprenylcysteine carboxylmethyltransferase family protein [Chloroflexi bacterium]|nr:isoprenylcysteine carboxylmethyltransferase family protein [Chloroflexota bacterium]
MTASREGRNGPSYARMWADGLLRFVLMMAPAFLLAGRLDYWQLWVFTGLMLLTMAVSFVAFRRRADLVSERLYPGPGVKAWDKVWMALYLLSFVATFVIASLDAGRFGWTKELPVPAYLVSYAVLILASSLIGWAMWTNPFFAAVVRIQTDRGQVVIQSGPYRLVRHPGYVGGILLGLSLPWTLGSLWALAPGSLGTVLVVVRTYLEDVTLQRELPGYSDYVKKVRYRLLPGVW